MNSGQGFGPPPRSGSSNSSTYESSSIYTGMARNQPPPSSQPMGPGGGGAGSDLFPAFLDADEQTRHHNQGPGFVAMDWPVHGGSANASAGPSGTSSSGKCWTHFLRS
jgi:MADS-box transcription factor